MRIIILTIISSGLISVALAQITELKLASDVWPPFTNEAHEQSLATDLVAEALHRTGSRMQTEIHDFEAVIKGIQNKQFDGSAALWHTPERAEYLAFSAPYLHNQLVLVGRKGSDVSASDLTELKDKRVAVVGSYAYGDQLREDQGVHYIPGANDQENLDRLLSEEVDYILVDALLIQYLTTYQKKEVADHLEIGKSTLLRRSLHFAIRNDLPNAAYIIQRFNEEIVKMVADGSYNRILQLNWIRADVDGDGHMELVLNGTRAGTTPPVSSYDVLFQNTASASTGNNNRFYVEGKVYNGWDNVPRQYKVAPMKSEKLNKMEMLQFSF
jgi:ABC-type amino acid transport substrate-binding protein